MEDKAIEALEIIKRWNILRNDLDAYLREIANWGLGLRPTKPNESVYGLVEEE